MQAPHNTAPSDQAWAASGSTTAGRCHRYSAHEPTLGTIDAMIACCHGCCMTNKLTDLANQLVGQRIARVDVPRVDQLMLHFSEGATLGVTWSQDGLQVQLSKPITSDASTAAHRPTKRQLDYLMFIRKYLTRYGRAPAESDIERHFLVSAPSVNQMMQKLERRGFITRQAGVPRSARICIDLDSQT